MTLQRLMVQPQQVQGATLTLTAAQQHYLQRVLRLRPGDRFIALDGHGRHWLAALTTAATAQLLESLTPAPAQPQPPLTLAAALPKQGFDDVVRQATELGVDRIVPILSDRTLLRPSDHKLQRWRRIATEAAEQCERSRLPQIEAPLPWTDWVGQTSPEPCHLIAVARQDSPPLLAHCPQLVHRPVVIAIGPEGGWTEAEIATAIAAGYLPVTLGDTVLRAVTASVAALSILHAGIRFARMAPG